ncbi:MAG TPA: hypothetical protein VMZ50_10055 [Phycisphaerae bacterium]|nr:hypothetical protein [Phycisphaerae bacterium]
MKTTRTVWMIGMLLTAGLLMGCEKKVTLTYTNVTSNDVDVALVEHGVSGVPVTVPSGGGKVRQELKIDNDFLPVSYLLKAGAREKAFTIDKDTKDKLWFHILPTKIIGPLGEHDTAEAKWEHDIETKVESGEVVR